MATMVSVTSIAVSQLQTSSTGPRMLHKFERNAVGRFGRLRLGSFTYSDIFTSDCLLNVKDLMTKRAHSNVRPRTTLFDSEKCLPEMSEGS